MKLHLNYNGTYYRCVVFIFKQSLRLWLVVYMSSRTINDATRSVIDDTGVMLLIEVSLMTVTYNRNMFIVYVK
jgi:hypothetical protein